MVLSHNGLISKRTQKMWEADPIQAIEHEISVMVGNSVSPSYKQKKRVRELEKLKEMVEWKVE